MNAADEIIVRLARPDELRRVQDLNYELFVSDNRHVHDLNYRWPYEAEGTKFFRDRIAGGTGICLVAEVDGSVVGYLAGGLLRPNNAYTGRRAELDNICVTAEHRSGGVGAALVQAFYNWCRHRQVEHVMVNAYTANESAIKFYHQQGFAPYSTTLWHHLEAQ